MFYYFLINSLLHIKTYTIDEIKSNNSIQFLQSCPGLEPENEMWWGSQKQSQSIVPVFFPQF